MNDDVKLFGLGHSHVRALLSGVQGLTDDDKIAVDGICLRDDQFRNLPRRKPDSAAVREVRARAANADLVFLAIQGNQHNGLALLQSPIPIDFYHVQLSNLRIQDGATVVPYRTIRKIFEEQLTNSLLHYAYLKKLLDKPLVQCQPPPPNPSESYIRANSSAFQQEFTNSRVAAASYRLKMWKVQGNS